MIQRWGDWIGLLLLCTFFASLIGRKSKSITAGLLSGWILLSAVMVAYNPPLVNALIDLRLRTVAAKSFTMISMLLVFITFVDKKRMSCLFLFFEVLAVVETILLLTVGYGLFNTNSMDAAFVAMVWPVSLLRPKDYIPTWICFLLAAAPLAMFFAHVGNTVFIVIVAELLAFSSLNLRSINSKLALFTIPIVMWAAFFLNGTGFMHSDDRISQWKIFMRWLWESKLYWFGAGTGSMQVLGPAIQNKETDLFIWMHSEPLQIIFEQGLLGLVLAAALAYICLKKSRKTPWIFVASTGSLAAMLTQFPLRYFVGQIFVLLLVRESLESRART